MAGRGRDLEEQESYANLFYGRTASGDYAFSNSEELLAQFVGRVLPVEPHTYFANGEFTTYRDPSFRRTDDAGIEQNYSNARDIIALVNRILEQAADDSLRQTIARLFDEYFESQAPRARIAEFVEGNLDATVAGRVADLIDERIVELAAAERVDEQLTGRYKRILDDFIGLNAVPHTNIVKLGELEIAQTHTAYYHQMFEQVLTQVQLDEPVMLIGPAGSGKNFAVSQIAEGLGLDSEVHDGAGRRQGVAPAEGDDGFGMDTPVADGLPHGVAIHLNAGMRHHRYGDGFFLADDIRHPLLHVLFHVFREPLGLLRLLGIPGLQRCFFG